MIEFNKSFFMTIIVGILTGLTIVLIFALFASYHLKPSDSDFTKPPENIIHYAHVLEEEVIHKAISLFAFDINQIENGNDVLSSLGIVNLKIVAQANIGVEHRTLLEITTPNEVKQLLVKEGETVEGLLIKSISNKQLIVEKNMVEYTIKLFHPQELNLINTDASK